MAQISTRKRGNTWEYSFEIASVDGKRKRKSKGGFRTKKNVLQQEYRLKGIPFSFHVLRHTHATILIQNNVNIKEVQTRLGHKNIQTTHDIYTHLQPSDTINSVNVFENL